MKRTTWILVADGAKAQVLLSTGAGKELQHIVSLESQDAATPTHNLVSDRQGRSFSSGGANHSAIEPHTDPQRHAKEEFAHKVARMLNQRQGDFDRLVLVAPARTLGELRTALDAKISAKIIGELNKDLTHVTKRELPDHLGNIVGL